MKLIINTKHCVRMTVILLTLASWACEALSQEIPFRGSVEQKETQVIAFPGMSVEGTGAGNAAHIGHFTETFQHQVDLLTGLGTGTARFTGSPGDCLFTEISALGVETHIPGRFVVMERHLIVGGSGRFEGATGSFVLVRFIAQAASLSSSGTIEGTIVLAKSK
jgi:hypothetical protein